MGSDNGQLETVGEGLQGLNNKLLERALLDYLETLPEQVIYHLMEKINDNRDSHSVVRIYSRQINF